MLGWKITLPNPLSSLRYRPGPGTPPSARSDLQLYKSSLIAHAILANDVEQQINAPHPFNFNLSRAVPPALGRNTGHAYRHLSGLFRLAPVRTKSGQIRKSPAVHRYLTPVRRQLYKYRLQPIRDLSVLQLIPGPAETCVFCFSGVLPVWILTNAAVHCDRCKPPWPSCSSAAVLNARRASLWFLCQLASTGWCLTVETSTALMHHRPVARLAGGNAIGAGSGASFIFVTVTQIVGVVHLGTTFEVERAFERHRAACSLLVAMAAVMARSAQRIPDVVRAVHPWPLRMRSSRSLSSRHRVQSFRANVIDGRSIWHPVADTSASTHPPRPAPTLRREIVRPCPI